MSTHQPMVGSPFVSVIIPTFNREGFIDRALESVIAQTYENWECLVVDDASTDNTEAVVRGFNDSRIHYLRHDINRGGSAARNTGIQAARGEYLAFLDSDDEWLPEKLQKQLDVFESHQNPNLGAMLCGRILITPSYQEAIPGPDLDGDVYRTIVTHGLGGLGTSGFLVHRCIVEAGIGFDDSLPACQDRDFMAQVARKFHVDSLKEPLIRQHRGHGDGHLWYGLNAARGLEKLIDKYSEDLILWPSDLARLHTSAGIKFAVEGERYRARYHLNLARRKDPYHRSVYVWLLISIFGSRAARMALRVATTLSPD